MAKTSIAMLAGTVIMVVIAGLLWFQSTAHPVALKELHQGEYTHTVASKGHVHSDTSHTDEGEMSDEELSVAVLAAIGDGKYKCCLREACTSCFLRHQNEAEELLCDCLNDIVAGKAPCRECVNGILAGTGNKYLADYFARSLSERLGEAHYPELVAMVTEQYGLAAEEQY